jgi:hypothetical protein
MKNLAEDDDLQFYTIGQQESVNFPRFILS